MADLPSSPQDSERLYPKEEFRFVRTVVLAASPDSVWETLVDPYALSWMVVGCDYTAPVPSWPPAAPVQSATAEQRCWWRRFEYGLVSGGVFEVATLEPRRRLRYTDMAPRALRFEFILEPDPGGCRVALEASWDDVESSSAGRELVKRWVRKLPKTVLAGPIAQPPPPQHLLDGPGLRPREITSSIDVSASLDTTWAAAEDPDGTMGTTVGSLREWLSHVMGVELSYAIYQKNKQARAVPSVAQIIRHGPYHLTSRSTSWESEQRVVPHGSGGRLIIVQRWTRRHPAKPATVEEEAREWLRRVKAVAEGM